MPARENFDALILGCYEGRKLIYAARTSDDPPFISARFVETHSLSQLRMSGSRETPCFDAYRYASIPFSVGPIF